MNNWGLADLERRLANLVRFGVVEQLDEAGVMVRVRSGGILTDWLRWQTNRAGPDSDWWALEPGEQVILIAPSGELNQAVVIGSLNQNSYPAPADRRTVHRVQYADGAIKDYDRAASTDRVTYPDGTIIEYDATAGKYSLLFSGGTTIEVDANAGDVTADVTGNLTATITKTLQADVGTQATVTSPVINLIGTVNITGPLNLAGPLSAVPGAAGSGASLQGGFEIDGPVDVTGGDVTADGISLKGHTHPGDSGGTTGAPQ